MKLRQAVLFLSIIFLMFTCAYEAQACDCAASGPPCQSFWKTDAVFSATVISKSVTTVETGNESLPREQLIAVKLLVEDTFRGSLGGNDVEIVTGMGGGDCGYNFEKGKKYLVYASEWHGRLYAGICSRTRPLNQADEDLAYFRNLPAENSGSNIRAKVLNHTPPLNETDKTYGLNPMENVKIIAESGDQKYEGHTNASGQVEFRNVTPGKYKITSDIPHTEGNYWQTELTVEDRACAAVEFRNNVQAKISGTVFDENGNVATGIKIDLIELASATSGSPSGRWRFSTNNGTYEIPDVPPGRYLLGINLIGAQSAQCPVSRTLYTNPSSSVAGYVEVKQGNDLKGYDLRVATAGIERTIEGVVVWPNGKPAVRATVSLVNSTMPYRISQHVVDGEGHFVLRGIEGCTYRVQAWTYGGRISATSNETEEMRHAEPPTITLTSKPLAPLRLVLSSPGFIHEDDEKKTPQN